MQYSILYCGFACFATRSTLRPLVVLACPLVVLVCTLAGLLSIILSTHSTRWLFFVALQYAQYYLSVSQLILIRIQNTVFVKLLAQICVITDKRYIKLYLFKNKCTLSSPRPPVSLNQETLILAKFLVQKGIREREVKTKAICTKIFPTNLKKKKMVFGRKHYKQH